MAHHRIRATDRGGRVTFFNTATVRVKKTIELSVGPKPFTSSITVRSSSAGRAIRCGVLEGADGCLVMSGLEALPAGWYLLRAEGGDGTVSVEKVMKQ